MATGRGSLTRFNESRHCRLQYAGCRRASQRPYLKMHKPEGAGGSLFWVSLEVNLSGLPKSWAQNGHVRGKEALRGFLLRVPDDLLTYLWNTFGTPLSHTKPSSRSHFQSLGDHAPGKPRARRAKILFASTFLRGPASCRGERKKDR